MSSFFLYFYMCLHRRVHDYAMYTLHTWILSTVALYVIISVTTIYSAATKKDCCMSAVLLMHSLSFLLHFISRCGISLMSASRPLAPLVEALMHTLKLLYLYWGLGGIVLIVSCNHNCNPALLRLGVLNTLASLADFFFGMYFM